MRAVVLPTVLLLTAPLPRGVRAFNNGAPHSRLPPLGWSSCQSPPSDLCFPVTHARAHTDVSPSAGDALGAGDDHPVRDFCDTVSVKAAADAYVEVGLYDAGYRHLHLDDCWAGKQRNASGYIQPDPIRFPGGMKEVADYVHSKGLVFGLYTSAGRTTCMGGRAGSQGHWREDAATFVSSPWHAH
jgi:hypothetical protein